MKTDLECIPCFFQQVLRVGRLVFAEEQPIKELLDTVGQMLQDIPLDQPPPEIARLIYGKIGQISGREDPFAHIKQQSTRQALALYPRLQERVKKSLDPLLTAIRVAIAGNVIDFGTGKSFEVEEELERILAQDFALFDYSAFQEDLARSDRILYLADNAGETVFDRVLIERLGKPVIYAVREAPIINDATAEDARQAGVEEVAEIISSGCGAPAVIPHLCSREFKHLFETCCRDKLVISKGQGNYEGLSQESGALYYLLTVKCGVVARHLGVTEGAIILKRAGAI